MHTRLASYHAPLGTTTLSGMLCAITHVSAVNMCGGLSPNPSSRHTIYLAGLYILITGTPVPGPILALPRGIRPATASHHVAARPRAAGLLCDRAF